MEGAGGGWCGAGRVGGGRGTQAAGRPQARGGPRGALCRGVVPPRRSGRPPGGDANGQKAQPGAVDVPGRGASEREPQCLLLPPGEEIPVKGVKIPHLGRCYC